MGTFLPFSIVIVGTFAFAGVGTLLVRQLVYPHFAEGHNDVVVPIFQTAGTIYAVFLAFLVVAVWQAYDTAHDTVAEEASVLATLYRASTAMERRSGDELRRLIRAYTTAVIDDEWQVQSATGGTSTLARADAVGMYRLFDNLDPGVRERDAAIDGAVLSLVGQILADRNKRTLAAGAALPPIMWLGAVGIGIIVVVMSFFLYMERRWPHLASAGVMASVIAMLLSITFVLSRPFVGPMALGPEPFQHSLEVYDSVDAMR